jgi:ribosome-associated protein
MSRMIYIPDEEIELRSILAAGPGGQNVNKVATAIQLRFDVRRSPSLPDDVRARLIGLAGNRLTRDGVLVLTARTHRTREGNKREALERLTHLVERAQHVPKKRVKTKPPPRAKRARLEDKKRSGKAKALRRRPRADD